MINIEVSACFCISALARKGMHSLRKFHRDSFNMKFLERGILALLPLLAGCSTSISMFPAQGPLRNDTPNPVLIASADGITSNSGRFTVTYPNGDECVGRWASLAPQMVSTGWGSLFTKHGSITGVSFSTTNMPGINRGEAMAVCKSGNRLQVEFYTGSGTASGLGVASDDNGNVFKLIF